MRDVSNAPVPGANGQSRPLVVFTRADLIEFRPTDWLMAYRAIPAQEQHGGSGGTVRRRQELPGLPQVVRSDNGPEFLGEAFTSWLKTNGVALQYIQPGKPNQNAFIERFNRTFREEVLDRHLFACLDDVREATHWWMIDYNEERSHDSLGGMTPVEYRNQHAESSTFVVPA